MTTTDSDADKYSVVLNHLTLARKHLDYIKALVPGRLKAGVDATLKHLDKLDNALTMKYKEVGNG